MIEILDKKIKKYCNLLLMALLFVYTVSMSSKLAYSAQISVILSFFGTTKAEVGIGLTVYYIIYAVSQIVLAIFIKKVNMRVLYTIFISLSAITFSLVVFVSQLWQLWLILGLNGLFHSCIWMGCVHFMAKYLPTSLMVKASNTMSTGFAIGTALAYGISAFFTGFLGWQYSFLFFGILTFASLVVFLLVEKKVGVVLAVHKAENTVYPQIEEKQEYSEEIQPRKRMSKKMLFAIIILVVSVFFINIGYYSLSNWVPNLMKEVHLIPDQYSILLTLLMPVGLVFGSIIVCNTTKRHKNINAVVFWYSLLTCAVGVLLCFVYKVHFSIALIAVVIMLMFPRGINSVTGSVQPLIWRDEIDAGMLCGIINASTAIAAAISPVISGAIIDSFGWLIFFIFVIAMCLIFSLCQIPLVFHKHHRR